jgi:hypothetical protein
VRAERLRVQTAHRTSAAFGKTAGLIAERRVERGLENAV